MKENRKLLKEVIKGIKRDMTDEDVLNLLADSKVSENPNREKDKYTVGQREAGHLFFRLPAFSFCGCLRTCCLLRKRSIPIRSFC